MSTIVLRSVKGTPLTNTEVDSNFTNLNTDKLELGGTYSSGTATGVLYLSSSKVLTTGSALTFDGAQLGVNGITVGRGAGAVSTNTAVGASALAANTSGANNAAFAQGALQLNTTGAANTALGLASIQFNTTGSNNTGVGYQALNSNTTASNNTAVGYQAGYSNTTGTDNISIGRSAGYGTTTTNNNIAIGYNTLSQGAGSANNVVVGHEAQRYVGTSVVAIGHQALTSSTANSNTAVGHQASYSNITGTGNVALGSQTLYTNTAGIQNTAIGENALYTNTADNNTAVGYYALRLNTTGTKNTAVGVGASQRVTTGADNTSLGYLAFNQLTTGSYNTALGSQALGNTTTASNNTAVGYQAGYSNTTGESSVFIGYYAGYNSTGGSNVFIGRSAGYAVTTGTGNTFVGPNIADGSGRYMTTGSKNTILGGYNGNQGGLDIRTANNYIVLSDGDGNPRIFWDYVGTAYNQNQFVSSGTITQSQSNSSYTTSFIGENTYLGANTSRLSMLHFGSDLANAKARDTMLIGEPTGGHILVSPNASNKSIKLIPGTWTSAISMELQDAGSIKLGYGQLEFPATQNASSNANTLDDYERGTFSPSIAGWSGTYLYQVGWYTKIGRQVSVFGRLRTNGGSGSFGGSGFVELSNLPFAAFTGTSGNSAINGTWAVTSGSAALPSNYLAAGPLDGPWNGGTAAFSNIYVANGNVDNALGSYFSNSSDVEYRFQLTYFTN